MEVGCGGCEGWNTHAPSSRNEMQVDHEREEKVTVSEPVITTKNVERERPR